MPRIRTIKPEFFTSPDTARVSHAARLLYIAMWCLADDYGKGEFNMLQLRAFAFPEEDPWLDQTLAEPVNNMSKEFQSLCKEVVDGYGIKVYKHHGRTYYAIPSWDEHQKTQRRANSKNPSPDDPESSPDQRFHDEQGSSEPKQGNSLQTQGNTPLGTGEQGTGERERDISPERDFERPLDPHAGPEAIPDTTYGYPDGFEQWWDTYPRPVGKREAFEAWFKAIKRIPHGDLLDATRRFADFHAQDGTEERFIPHPAKWLSRDGWGDKLTPNRGPGAPQTRQQRTDEEVLQDMLQTPQNGPQAVIDGQIINHRQIG